MGSNSQSLKSDICHLHYALTEARANGVARWYGAMFFNGIKADEIPTAGVRGNYGVLAPVP